MFDVISYLVVDSLVTAILTDLYLPYYVSPMCLSLFITLYAQSIVVTVYGMCLFDIVVTGVSLHLFKILC